MIRQSFASAMPCRSLALNCLPCQPITGHVRAAVCATGWRAIAGLVARWRMNLAAKALRETNRTLDEIGRAIGYESAPSFSQAFTWLTGQSPGRYRRSLQSLGPTT
ncbi:helix-turn-helix domain-containing protein [Mesorhizobium caraganae]|uniref:helix-turn-helix domain-containing protein n=1 Tax=Mesorhizobium caraganae TaxID=483206 RepID=UPI0033359B8D